MEVRSLGYRTDLMVRHQAGADVVDRGGYVAVRTPANPTYYWGNFVLVPAPPKAGSGRATADAQRWLEVFSIEHPTARHVAIGVDGTKGDEGDTPGFLAAGLTVSRNVVLRAQTLRAPTYPNRGATYRPLAGNDDWEEDQNLRWPAAGIDRGVDSGDQRAFGMRRSAEARDLVGRGHGVAMGAFVDGHLRASLWLVAGARGVARFQEVMTHPEHRRQGLGGTLVYEAERYGVEHLGVRTLVMVADPAGPAIGLYRTLGFFDFEQQVHWQRSPAAAKGP